MDNLISADPDALTPEIRGWLEMQGIATFTELSAMTQWEILELPYSGRRKLEEIITALDRKGIKHRLHDD